MPKPVALLFDVNGTLFPADSAASAFRELGLPSSAVEVWFSRVLRDGFAAQLAGSFQPFRHWAAHHLACLLSAHGSPSSNLPVEQALARVLSAWSAADLWPDAGTGLRALHASGLRLAVLTNGSADSIARSVLQKAGLEGVFSCLLDVGMAGAWKPAPQSYAWAVEQLGLAPGQVMMVASHPWDIYGALQAGLQAAYVQRDRWDAYPAFLPQQPQLVASSFNQLAEQLAAA
ncbi:hypothetical protein CHLNCDRAFT_28513 [Chlorella variabilis]|uniref:Haloacid dehalogenase, type II n=1 Tax=Chlorella variabilis TaxID=554065 RepID=E1ZTA6_CHLVA|nr:hypothetical protein CHLNCDRAFT_28513 [Chlorella variabilis]EFN50965.1 hypothetical protein CHLNCDRAFT_28513 [Chlorella variabilis]|eukprot:XP_005843067.1 hypothetical protein CHLNCDRAFT_28513 [Chlorella variabilis]